MRKVLKTKYFIIIDYGNTVPRNKRYVVNGIWSEGTFYSTTINAAVRLGRSNFNRKSFASYMRMMRAFDDYVQGVYELPQPTTRDTFRDTELPVSDFIELPADYYR